MAATRLFLLSPASCSGSRARLLLAPSSAFPLAEQLRSPQGAPLGDVFAFVSQLYFRGKLAYGRAFARTGDGPHPALDEGVFVITTSRGPLSWRERVGADTLREFAAVQMHQGDGAYTRTLEAGARLVAERAGPSAEVVLLGSIASDKYVRVLTEVFGSRLLFPRQFIGRGDMSRGGLLLRCVREGRELDYIPVMGSRRHGSRPPRLGPLGDDLP
ncbi:MAG TPA: hypothetical protein VK911_02555 [Vicinamibacterales bacterium]|nr:hypothetical protein [Vicinamibacterales bacterium]